MSTYLVTGGAGFIGSHIAETLVGEGHEVRVLDNLSTGKRENMASFEPRINWVEGDLRDVDTVERAVDGVEYVVHQAALASVPRSIKDPVSSSQVNVQGTLNLLEAAKKRAVKKFVYASSSSVYGDSETLPKREDMPPNPKSPYAVTKLTAELYCRVYSEIHGVPTVSLRYFNVFGPRQDPNSQYSAVIPLFVTALSRGERPTIHGDGEQSRDFTYIDNVVQANLRACRSPERGAMVFNVACGERFSLNALYDRLQAIIGVNVEPNFGPPRAGDVKHSQAAIDAIGAALGYTVEIGFDDGLKRTVAWYRSGGV
ncbi:MAG: SDR family oxidoreductase [Candidatus Krumholzibacteriia bacterium]